jgi:TolB protein
LNPPRLWLLDVKSGEMAPVFGDSQKLAFDARWSGDGKWLSYLSPDFGGVGVLNLESGQMQFYETPTGETGVWHPKRNQVLISVLRQIGEQYVTHLLLIDPVSSEQRNLSSEDALVEDSSAVWSPDGKWIAFRRRWLEGEAATLSRQLWRMRSDGSEAKPLTASDEFEHGAPVWTPDGNYLVYHKFPLKVPAITLSIWAMDVESGQQWELVNPGQRPLIIQQQTALADLKLCLTQHTNLLY